MIKKQTTEVAEAKHRPSGDLVAEASVHASGTLEAKGNLRTSASFEFTMQDALVAEELGMVLSGSAADRLTRAVTTYNQAARLTVEAGYLLLSVRADVEHGKFLAALDELGLPQRRAYELMQSAKFISTVPEAQRAELLTLPKSKVLALASADPAVIEQMLEDGDVSDLDDMSVRGLRLRIRELEAGTTDLAVERDTALADLKAVEKKLKRSQRDEEDAYVPSVVADMRAEMAALVKKAELAITSMHPVGVEIVNLRGHDEAREWVEPSLRLGLSGLLAVRELIDGSIKSFTEAMGEQAKRLRSQPDALAFLDGTEVKTIAEDWARLTATHQHEAALREHERAQAKPRGKGRPAKAPEAPAKA